MIHAICLMSALSIGQSPGAPTSPNGEIYGVVHLVDPVRRLIILELPSQGGHRYWEYQVPPNAHFYAPNKKPIRNGMRALSTQKFREREQIPLTIHFDRAGKISSVQIHKKQGNPLLGLPANLPKNRR